MDDGEDIVKTGTLCIRLLYNAPYPTKVSDLVSRHMSPHWVEAWVDIW